MTLSASLDKETYEPGETATLTLAYTVPAGSTISTHAVLEFLGGAESSPPVTAVVKRIRIVDDSGRVWTEQSDAGSVAVFTATV